MGPEHTEGPAQGGQDSVGIAGVNGVLRVHVVPGGAPLLLSKEFLRDRLPH